MIKYITILEHNHVYTYYFSNHHDSLNNASFYKRNMKQTIRIGSTISGLYNESYRMRDQMLNHYIDFDANGYFARFRFLNSTKQNFQKLRKIKKNN